MSNHVTADVVERYRRGTLPPDVLLVVDDHLQECAACRASLAADPQATGGVASAAT